jgi:hypothetical protein
VLGPTVTPKERSDNSAGGVQEEEQVGFNIVLTRMDERLKVHSSGIQQGNNKHVVLSRGVGSFSVLYGSIRIRTVQFGSVRFEVRSFGGFGVRAFGYRCLI